MKIGTQLKRIRNLYGLTQTEMSAGVITEPFYSRVERGVSEMKVEDLLAVLEHNNISLYDFFEVFDDDMINQFGLHNQIIEAVVLRDLKTLKKLAKQDCAHGNTKLQLELQLVIAELEDRVGELSDSVQRDMKYGILQVGAWSRKSLWEFLITIPLYGYSELQLLMTNIVDWQRSGVYLDSLTMEMLAAVVIAYVRRCFEEKEFIEARKMLEFIEQLPDVPVIMLQKLLAYYYVALLDDDQDKIEQIKKVLQLNGYEQYMADFVREG